MLSLTVVSHALAAAVYAALAALLATRWRHRMRGSLLLVASVVTAIWAVTVVVEPNQSGVVSLVGELAKGLAWIAFLRQAFAGTSRRELPQLLRFAPPLVAAIAIGVGAWAAYAQSPPLGPIAFRRTRDIASLALAILGFVSVEQVLRNTRENKRWAAKFLWLGAGAVFAYDIALFSATYAFGQLQPALAAARGFALTLSAPLLAIGVRRIGDFRPQVFMSQKLAFFTTSLLIAGLYLVGVAIVGYYVRVLGGNLGDVLQVLVVFAAIVGLVAVASSTTVRARLRVLLAKHWFPYKYDYRNEWLDLTERLTRSADGSSLAERTMDAFQRLGGSSGGSIFVMRDGFLQLAAGELFDARTSRAEPASGGFCGFLEAHEWIVDLDRARAGRGRDAEVPVPKWLSEEREAWLAIPLLHERKLQAMVVLRRPLIEQQLAWEELDLLRTASRQAASYFALASAGEALVRERQFATLNRLTAFLMHDLSNVVAQQRLIVENAARHKTNPAFVDDAIATIDGTVRRMGRLLEQLKTGSLESSPRRVRLAEICQRVAERLSDRVPRPQLVIRAQPEALIAAERFEHVLEHVVRNAQDATPAGGSVALDLGVDDGKAVIQVTDTGCGMEDEFVRSRLFRPFDTTKGAQGMGIGAFQAREFVRSAGGDVDVSSTPGIGTIFVLRLPLVS